MSKEKEEDSTSKPRGREVVGYEKVDFASLVKSVNADFLTLDDVRRLSELLITRLHTPKAPLQHVHEWNPTPAEGRDPINQRDSLFHTFPNRRGPAWLMAEHARKEGYEALAEVILSQEKQCWDNASMFFMQTPGLHTYNQDADDFLAAPPQFYYYLRRKWYRLREWVKNPQNYRAPHSGATDNLPTMNGNKVFLYHILLSSAILAAYVWVADSCARAKPGDHYALRCLEAETFTRDHVPNLLVTSLPVFFAVFFVNTAFQHFRRVWTMTFRFNEELSEILTQFLLMSAIEVNLFKAKVKKDSGPKGGREEGPRGQEQAAAKPDDVNVRVGGGADEAGAAAARSSNKADDEADCSVEEEVVIPAAIVGNALDLARFSGMLAIFLYHSLNPITYNVEAFVPFMIERYGLCEYGLMDAIDWHRWIQPRILTSRKHQLLWKNHAFMGKMSHLRGAQHWGSAVTQWASEGVLDVIMRGRHLQHTNDPPIVSFNIKTWQDLVAAKNELIAEQAKLLPRVVYNTMWLAIVILYVFQFIKQSTACGNALARTGATPGTALWGTIAGKEQPYFEGVTDNEEEVIDGTQAFLSGLAYMLMFNFFFVIVRMVLDLLDPVAPDADSVPILPLLDSTMQRLFNRVILRTVAVMVRQEAFEEKLRKKAKTKENHNSGAEMFSSPLATLQLGPDETEHVRYRDFLRDTGDEKMKNVDFDWSLRTFDGLPAPFPSLKHCSDKTRQWARAILGVRFVTRNDADLESGYRSGRLGDKPGEVVPPGRSTAETTRARTRIGRKAEGDKQPDVAAGDDSSGPDEFDQGESLNAVVEEDMNNLDAES